MPDVKMPLLDETTLAGQESNKGTGNAVKHGDRIAAAGVCKQRSKKMAEYLRDHGTTEKHKRLYSEISGCANYLVFHNYYTKSEIRLAKARTCKKHLLCPFCARARGAKLMEKNVDRVAKALEDNPRLIPAMLTLTVANQDELKRATEHLTESFRILLNRRRTVLKNGRGSTEFAKIEGAIYATEVTHSEKTGWHPHIHAVVLLNDYIDQKALSEEWNRVTGDSFVVDIRKLKTDHLDDLTNSLKEIFKYAVKFADLPLDRNLEAYELLNGKRLIGSFGCLHGLKLPEKLTDDLYDDLPYIEMFYKYASQKAAFELTEAKRKQPLREQLNQLDENHEQLKEENREVFGFTRNDRHPDAENARQSRGLRSPDTLRSDLKREQEIDRLLYEARDDCSANDDLSSFYLYGET